MAADGAAGEPSVPSYTLADLAPFLVERGTPPTASADYRLFMAGVDDIHGALKWAIGSARRSLYLTMYGYDDDELNRLVMQKLLDPAILVVVTLDKSQAGGIHEKRLLEADRAQAGLARFDSHFAIGMSEQHRILHTKGGVIDGWLGFEGSVNWSDDGEGTFVLAGQAGGAGYRAQANTLTFFTDPYAIARFTDRLVAEHAIAKAQENGVAPRRRQLKLAAPPASS